jgi:hypothetical protein
MAIRRTRRQRLLTNTLRLGAAFAALAGVALWLLLRSDPTYRPGEEVDGLTAQLARDLPDDYPRVRFVEVTQETGIAFQHFHGRRSTQLPEDMGSGAAWGDYDNDGWPDLFVVNAVGALSLSENERADSPATSVLYHNNGDGSFTDMSAEAGVAHRAMGMGAGWGDYDGDGWIDLFVSAYGESTLYRNNGDGTFGDVSDAAGVGGQWGFWAGVAWADYDRDGDLDLYVTGYVRYEAVPEGTRTSQYEVEEPASLNPSSFPPERNLLYRNNGDGTFTEVAAEAGVVGDAGRSLEATWTDFDEDGWLDLYVANDVSDNVLYRNLGRGRFLDVSYRARVADYRGAMGIAVGDWDGDADLDMFVTHWIAQENALYDNQLAQLRGTGEEAPAPLQFMDTADRFGLGQVALDFIGWGTAFVDYDNDGRLDLFVVNGSTFQQRDAPHVLVPMTDLLFWNRGVEHGFYNVSPVSGEYFSREEVGRGAAFADYDRDGDVDVFVVNNGGPGTLLRNEGGNARSWLAVRLEGTQSNHRGVGAHIRIVAGGAPQVRQVGTQSSYLSQSDVVQHFGLGDAQQVDTLEVFWPMGGRDVLTALTRNQIVSVVEGSHR